MFWRGGSAEPARGAGRICGERMSEQAVEHTAQVMPCCRESSCKHRVSKELQVSLSRGLGACRDTPWAVAAMQELQKHPLLQIPHLKSTERSQSRSLSSPRAELHSSTAGDALCKDKRLSLLPTLSHWPTNHHCQTGEAQG